MIKIFEKMEIMMQKFIKTIKKKFLSNFSNLKGKSFSPYPPQKKINGKIIWFWASRFLLAFVIFILFLFAWFAKDLPTPGKLKGFQAVSSSQIFDRNGKPLYSFSGDIKRYVIDSKDIPNYVKKATITAEDRNFYSHWGFDFKGVLRAIYTNLVTGKTYQGGSTITQQYVKNAILDSKKTLTRKVKELILSIEIEIMYNKEQILTMYLNEIPYGGTSYGIQAASKTFFNKDARDLSLAEAATLAALPQAPTYYSPNGSHPDQRLYRVNWILDNMVKEKYITQDEANRAKLEVKNIKFSQSKEYITAPHFVAYVKEQLVNKYGEKIVNEGGLKVTTTLDLDLQAKAETAVAEGFKNRFDNIKATNAALVAIDPKNGQILSMVGSADFLNTEIDGQVNVADSLRQPGSSFKPIVYATAFKEKYNPAYTLWDVPTDFGNYNPHNYDGITRGPVSIRTALAGSLNIPAVKILGLVGLDKALQTARDFGITTLTDKDRYGLSLVLGGGEIKLTELTNAYGVFANEGKASPMMDILKVEDGKGKILEEYKETAPKEVISPQISYEISSILSDNNARSYVFGSNSALYFGDRNVAVKTGTTNAYRDAWTIGYTPSLVAGVWVGNNDNSAMTAGAAGAMAAAPIWHKFLASALEGKPNEEFTKPAGITSLTVDKLSNKWPTENSPETISDIFASWQTPQEKDNIHTKVKIDKLTGNLATPTCPIALTEDKTFTNLHSEMPNNPNWEYPVREAALNYGVNISYPPTETSCSLNVGKPQVNFIGLTENTNVNQNFEISVSASSQLKIKTVDYLIDNKKIGSSNKEPYTIKTPNLTVGKHKITVNATDELNGIGTSSVNIIVGKDNVAPDKIIGVTSKTASTVVNLYWTNPTNADLGGVNIYVSTVNGVLGNSVLKVMSSQTSAKISGLANNQTYYFTLRPYDISGNENQDTTQYVATPM